MKLSYHSFIFPPLTTSFLQNALFSGRWHKYSSDGLLAEEQVQWHNG